MSNFQTAILPVILALLAFPAAAQKPHLSDHSGDMNRSFTVAGFEVTGTRAPSASIVRLSGLKVGETVNFQIMSDACNKITSTGLFKAVDYAYKVSSSKPEAVISFTVWDEVPLLSAKMNPEDDTRIVWSCLQSADPIFTRELPNTQAALRFYSVNIDRCLSQTGNPNLYSSPTVLCGPDGKPNEIVFNIRNKDQGTAPPE